jgi:hypothetical protein
MVLVEPEPEQLGVAVPAYLYQHKITCHVTMLIRVINKLSSETAYCTPKLQREKFTTIAVEK